MRISLSDSLARVDYAPTPKPAKIANNTFRYRRADGTEVIRLHTTDIIEKRPDGRVILNSGGWKSVTTKDRLNSYSGYSVGSKPGGAAAHYRGVWFVRDRSTGAETPFYDGIILPDAFENPAKGEKAAKAAAKLKKEIKAFVDATIPDGARLPEPNGGDCWVCSMFEREAVKPATDGLGRNVNSTTLDSEHIKSHIKERYMHGSLIWNALAAAGYRHPEFAFGDRPLFDAKRVRQVVSRYLKKRMGLPV